MGSNSFRRKLPSRNFNMSFYLPPEPHLDAEAEAAFLVNEEKQPLASILQERAGSAVPSPATDIELDRDFIGCDRAEALQHAENWRMKLQLAFTRAEFAVQDALQSCYAVILTIMAAPPSRRTELLGAFGCEGNPNKPFLRLINSLVPVPDAELFGKDARKRAQNRNSTYAMALRAAWRMKVPADEFGIYCDQHGRVEGLAEIDRAARRRPRLSGSIADNQRGPPKGGEFIDTNTADAEQLQHAPADAADTSAETEPPKLEGGRVFLMSAAVELRFASIEGGALLYADTACDPPQVRAVAEADELAPLSNETLEAVLRRTAVEEAGR